MGNPYAPPGEGSTDQDQRPVPHQGGPGPGGPEQRRPDRAPWPTGAGAGPAGHDDAPHGGHGGAPDGPAPAPERPPPSPEQLEATRVASRRALRFYAFLIAGLLTLPLPVPWQGASLLFVLGAIGVGVHGFVEAWRGGVRGATLAALGVMTGVAGLVALMMLSLLAVWPQQLDRQRCLAGAVTIAATRACDAQFERAVEQRLEGMTGTPRP